MGDDRGLMVDGPVLGRAGISPPYHTLPKEVTSSEVHGQARPVSSGNYSLLSLVVCQAPGPGTTQLSKSIED